MARNCSIVAEDGILRLFSNDFAITVLQGFTKIMPDASLSTHKNTNVECTSLTLARLNAVIATALTSLRDDEKDRSGSQRQKLFQDNFDAFLPVT